MKFLVTRKHRVLAIPGTNSPLKDEWRRVGAIEARSCQQAFLRATVLTGERDPENNLLVEGIAIYPNHTS